MGSWQLQGLESDKISGNAVQPLTGFGFQYGATPVSVQEPIHTSGVEKVILYGCPKCGGTLIESTGGYACPRCGYGAPPFVVRGTG
ncbi:hypothetical protein LCGC14_3149360 [marine sediment metagenome]|uniref:Uncharacterized protein n=1 Tax=marine sediment metagenome TaxID=412755 RepID=A0A0F8WIH8_9ZZZZ